MNDIIAYAMLLGALGSGNTMPFWATTNQYGIMPESSGAIIQAYAGQNYQQDKTFQYHWGLSMAGRSDKSCAMEFLPDEMYAGIKWKPICLDIGIWHRDRDFMGADPFLGSISTTSGNIIWSSNSRSMPGYQLKVDHWSIPGTRNILQLTGAWGDYKTLGKRYVTGSWMHNVQLYLTFNVWRFSFEAGIEQFAEWAGVSPERGPMPNSFRDYCRMCVGKSDTRSDHPNDYYGTLGDQRGRGKLNLTYRQDGWKIALQHDIPYDDKGFFWFENWQDGVNTIYFSFDDKDKWVTDVAYEFTYTMWQSGPIHNRTATAEELAKYGDKYPIMGDQIILGGGDNYFNNGEYRTGWTAFGRTIGLPQMMPVGTKDGTWNRNNLTLGVENNRLVSHHIGISGKLFRVAPYRLMLTYSRNYLTYSTTRNNAKVGAELPYRQFSAGLNTIIPLLGGRLNILPAIFCDYGQYLKNSFGAMLGIRYVIN